MSKRLTSELYDLLCKRLDNASADGLRKIMGDCQALTKTNCSWIEYEFSKVVFDMAQDQLTAGTHRQKGGSKLKRKTATTNTKKAGSPSRK